MKRTLIKVTVMGILLVGGIYLMEEKSSNLSNVALENIEALAAGEDNGSMWFCYGTASLDCPNGTKVKYFIDNYSLD